MVLPSIPNIHMPIELISDGHMKIAIVVRNNFHKDGLSFLTDENETLQFGYFSHPKGHRIVSHVHKPFERITYDTQEVLYVKNGHVKVNFFSQNQKPLNNSVDLYTNDWIILMAAGHGLEILKDSTIIEIKNGPYAGDLDKVRFDCGEK